MAAEEVHQLLAQEQSRCVLLEADIELEDERAAKYLDIILDTVTGEDNFGAAQPEGSRVLDAPRTQSTLARPTLPTVASVPAQSSSSPELTIARRPRPSSNPRPADRSSSRAENFASSRSSKRTYHFSSVPQSSESSTSSPSDARTSVPREVLKVGMEVEGIFERIGLRVTPLALTRTEASCAKETPGIGCQWNRWRAFVKLFGGAPDSEWPEFSTVPGYEHLLYANLTAQPFMPLTPGKPGLFLQLPTVIETLQGMHDKSTFHVFSNKQADGRLHYRGKYTKIPLPQIEFKWTKVHKRFQEKWIKLVLRDWDHVRAIRARIELRNKIEREPSSSEVQAYLQHQFTNQVTYKEVSAAFRYGKEKLTVNGIECTEYDSCLAAAMIQRAVQDNYCSSDN